jgi:hypothetical protein
VTFGITHYPSLYAPAGVFRPCTPAALCRWLSRPKVYATKTDAGRWGAFYSHGGRRRREDIVRLHALVYDVDAPIALDLLGRELRDLHTLTSSTWSATREAPRWRVVVFLDRPISPEEHSRVWRAGAERIERVAAPDHAAKDATHIWSAPAMRLGGYFAFLETHGGVLSVDEALRRFPEQKPIAPATSPTEIRSTSAYARGALLRAVAEVEGAQRGARAHTLNAVVWPIARFVATGELDEMTVIDAMVTAATSAGMPRTEALGIVRRAIRSRVRRAS